MRGFFLGVAMLSLYIPATYAFADATGVVPEPSDLSLIGLGLVALLVSRRWKK